MKKQIFCIAILLIAAFDVSAQTTDKTVEKIRTIYNGVAEQVRIVESDEEHGQYDDLYMNELVINKLNHEWRAVGKHVLTYKFYYKGGDSEEHLYPDQLVMVKVTRAVSNRSYTEEYLYSETGVLMFYFQKAENDEMSPTERRVYFSGIKAIRVNEDGKTRDRLTGKDATTVKEITGESNKIKDVFARTLKF